MGIYINNNKNGAVVTDAIISNNATGFQISKVFKTYYKNYLDSIDTTFELEYRSICEVLEKILCFQ